MLHNFRLVAGEINARGPQQRLSIIRGERHSVDREQKCQLEASSAAVGIVSSVTWTIGTSVEANLWPDLVVKG